MAALLIAEAAVASACLVVTAQPAPEARHFDPLLVARVAPEVDDSYLRDANLPDADKMARWAARSGDAGHRPFVIVDKANARVMAFDAAGKLSHSTPALLGLAAGDDSVPGIGTRAMAEIQPQERITPAGRFVARPGRNLDGEDIVWVDYDAAVSMHRVRATKASERRLQRLASATIADNRISYGCINLPVAFYDGVIHPMVKAAPVVIYVLPEVRPLGEVFAFHRPVAQRTALHAP